MLNLLKTNQKLMPRRAAAKLIAAAVLGATIPGPRTWSLAAAQTPRQLSPTEAADIERAESYLNSIRTLKARFTQIADTGQIDEGTFYLSRPGRLRLEYDPPNPNLLVANGTFLIHYDSSLKAVTHLPLGSTPAGVLVRERISFAGDLAVAAIESGPGALRITLIQASDPRAGRLTLIFGDRPFQLAKWRVIDAQGRATEIALVTPQINIALDPVLFRFQEPNNPADRG